MIFLKKAWKKVCKYCTAFDSVLGNLSCTALLVIYLNDSNGFNSIIWRGFFIAYWFSAALYRLGNVLSGLAIVWYLETTASSSLNGLSTAVLYML